MEVYIGNLAEGFLLLTRAMEKYSSPSSNSIMSASSFKHYHEYWSGGDSRSTLLGEIFIQNDYGVNSKLVQSSIYSKQYEMSGWFRCSTEVGYSVHE